MAGSSSTPALLWVGQQSAAAEGSSWLAVLPGTPELPSFPAWAPTAATASPVSTLTLDAVLELESRRKMVCLEHGGVLLHCTTAPSTVPSS